MKGKMYKVLALKMFTLDFYILTADKKRRRLQTESVRCVIETHRDPMYI